MASPPIPNLWHLRTVAEASAKNCMICFKPSTAVLITPNNKDFFYICRGHLKDRGFCSPLEDPEEKKRDALRIETKKIQQEYREKLAAKEKKEAERKTKEKTQTDGKDDMDAGGENDKKDADSEKDKSNKSKSDQATDEKELENPSVDEIARIYSLHRNFYQMRLERIRKGEIAKRNRERLSNPSSFPSVPSEFPY